MVLNLCFESFQCSTTERATFNWSVSTCTSMKLQEDDMSLVQYWLTW